MTYQPIETDGAAHLRKAISETSRPVAPVSDWADTAIEIAVGIGALLLLSFVGMAVIVWAWRTIF